MPRKGAVAPDESWDVELPVGGRLQLRGEDEVELWDTLRQRYVEDYRLTNANDLVLLGSILSQQLTLYRAQQRLNGMEAELDPAGVPTGRYIAVKLSAADELAAQQQVQKATGEIRETEKALGIDKKTREAGGQHTVKDYVSTLKQASNAMGVHILERVKKYEMFNMELRTRLRMLKNLDAEDRHYHGITPQSICDWAEVELAKIEEYDKQHASEKGKLWAGKL